MLVNKSGSFHRLLEKWYLVIICIVLVLRVFFWFSPSHAEKINIIYLWPTAIAATALLIYTRSALLPQGFRWLACLFLWLLLSCVVSGDPYLVYNHTFILYMFVSLICFYLVIPTLRGGNIDQGFRVLAMIYCGLMLMLALLGLCTALTGNPIRTKLSADAIYVASNRLYFLQYHPNEAASALTIGVLLFLYLALQNRSLLVKGLFILCALLLGVVIALTGSRTSMILSAAGMGAFAFWVGYSLLSRRPFWLRWLTCLVAFCVITVGAYQGSTTSIGVVASIAMRIQAPSSSTPAEETAVSAITITTVPNASQTDIVHMYEPRVQFQDIGTFNMRVQIWQSGIDYLINHPKALLFGVPDNVVSRIPATVGRTESHLHNAYLEMLVLGGIPGLLLYLGYLFLVLRACWRLAFHPSSSLPYCFLAIIPPLIALNGITEIYPLFSGNVMDMMSFAISGAVVALSNNQRKYQTSARAPHIRPRSTPRDQPVPHGFPTH